MDDKFLSSSPELHHKVPMRQPKGSDESDDDHDETKDNCLHTNLFGQNFIMRFEIGIEGKSPTDKEEEDWGGTVEFGFSDNKFAKNGLLDYFLLFEDECTQLNTCAGRVAGVLSHVRDKVIAPPSYDSRDIVELIEKYGDAHISDSGWREVDPEEWFAD